MSTAASVSATGIIPFLQHIVSITYLHPILVNFTAALIPISIISDIAARWGKSESLRHTAWWTLLFATIITFFTVVTGWLFWAPEDNNMTSMVIHKWLGSTLSILLLGLFIWRLKLYQKKRWASLPYLLAGIILIAALVFQGHLGGVQVFSGM